MRIRTILIKLLILNILMPISMYAQVDKGRGLEQIIYDLSNEVNEIQTLERKGDWLLIDYLSVNQIALSKMIKISQIQEIELEEYGILYVIKISVVNTGNTFIFKVPGSDSLISSKTDIQEYYIDLCKMIYAAK